MTSSTNDASRWSGLAIQCQGRPMSAVTPEARCPLYPRTRTLAGVNLMSAKCEKRTLPIILSLRTVGPAERANPRLL